MPVTLTYDLGLVMQGVVTAVGSRTRTSSLKGRISRKCPLISSASFPLAYSCPFNGMAFVTTVVWTPRLARRFPLLYTLTCLRHLGSKGATRLVERRDFHMHSISRFCIRGLYDCDLPFLHRKEDDDARMEAPIPSLPLSIFLFFFPPYYLLVAEGVTGRIDLLRTSAGKREALDLRLLR